MSLSGCRYLQMQASEKLHNMEGENQQLKQRVHEVLSRTEKAQLLTKSSKGKEPKGVDTAIDEAKVRTPMHASYLDIADSKSSRGVKRWSKLRRRK